MRSEKPLMQYVKEFMGQRVILFLFSVFFFSCFGVIATFGSVWTAVAMCVGPVLVIFIEYAVHRYILHEFPRIAPYAYKGHVTHHRYPTDVKYLFGPVYIDLCAYLLIFGAAFIVTGYDWHLSYAVVFGASGFQIYYQWKHYISHRPINPLTPWGKWLKKRHLLHHHLDEDSLYGVTNPVMDIILRTNRPKASKSRSLASHQD
ncbi:sterol desaturase family protein [Cohnella luojiensis]|uniref:Fatty acid hydroxylase family protein n=1 Tax=Cohnella luojiensis TaxID=652876 RepID=A0A4Y8LRN3_9BACL|nr:sterol desaturase family protein [Cohnella luojiensis]TFE22688.1 fatty acid hydroxylase family protein [Cohnella luojiensis]